MLQDFIDSGHLNKEHKDEMEYIFASQLIHHQSFNNALNRKKSANPLSEFLHNRKASSLNIDRIHSFHDGKMFSISTTNSNKSLHKSQVEINMHENESHENKVCFFFHFLKFKIFLFF
jgi:hypothetical protein